jgi:hypothetical protein
MRRESPGPGTGNEHGVKATRMRVRAAVAKTGNRIAAADRADAATTVTATPTTGSGCQTTETAGTTAMADPEQDTAKHLTEAQPGKLEGEAEATHPLKNGAEVAVADRREEAGAAAAATADLPEEADTAITNHPLQRPYSEFF